MKLYLAGDLEHRVHALHHLWMQRREHRSDPKRTRRKQQVLYGRIYRMSHLLSSNRQREDDRRSIHDLVGEP